MLINCFDAKNNGDEEDNNIRVSIETNKVIIGDVEIPVNKFKVPTRNFYKHMAVNLLRKIKKQIK